MGLAGFVATIIGILLVVLSANGRLQNVIAAAFGQQTPTATPTAPGSTGGGYGSWPTQGGPLWNWLLNQLQGGYNPSASGEGGQGGDQTGTGGGGSDTGGGGGYYGR